MRQEIRLSVLVASIASIASIEGGCKWTEFDDLENDTWVLSVEKPDVKSSDYGVAIQRGDDGSDSASSGTLAVIGAAEGTYSELAFSSTGGSSLKNNSLQLDDQGIMTLDPSPPLLLASPGSAEVALVTTGNNNSIVVATGTHTLILRQLFVGNTSLGASVSISTTPDTATYMQPPKFPDIADPPPPEPLVAAGDIVLGTVYGLPQGSAQPACKVEDGANQIQIRALGVVRNTTGPDAGTDDVLAWNGPDGKLHRYKGSVFNGCMSSLPPAPPIPKPQPVVSAAVPFMPGKGSQILTIDAGRVLLQGHQDVAKGNASFLGVYDSATLAPLGNPIMIDGVRTAAILVSEGTTYVLAGLPTASVDGKSAGEVQVYKLSSAGGFDPTTPVAVLHDAQPDSNQQFGRGVAAMPYNGKQVIAVAADNEIFVYYRANQTDGTVLLNETRQGR